MRLAAAILVLASVASSTAQPQSTSAKRGIGAAAGALSEWADRQAAINAEIELEEARADIEVDKQRRLRALRDEQARQRTPNNDDDQMAKLHPQWIKIVTSNIFTTWLDGQPQSIQGMCKKTHEPLVLANCIDSFFNTKLAKAR